MLGRGDELVPVHVRDEALAHRLGHFQQDLAIAVGLDQIPDGEALVERQRLEDVGDVRGMQGSSVLLQLGPVLLVDERLHQRRAAASALSCTSSSTRLLLLQQLHDLLERARARSRGLWLLDLRHGTLRLLARADNATVPRRASKRSFYGARVTAV